ncbi:MAG TPA: hypothetical protein VF447_17090, partial [Terriglobales bacterium]
MKNPTPEVAKLVNSQTLIQGVNAKGHNFRRLDINGPVPAQKNLTKVIQEVGTANVLIIQNSSGTVVEKLPVPRTEEEIFAIIRRLTGK